MEETRPATGSDPTADTPTPHETPPERFWVLYSAAALGAFCLGLGDLLNNGNASTVLKLGEILRQHLWPDLASSGLLAIGMLIFLGGAICWLHQPRTRVDAFARGFSVFALLAVATPYNAPQASLTDAAPGLDEGPNPVTTAPAERSAIPSWGAGHPMAMLAAAAFPAAQSHASARVLPARSDATATADIYLFEENSRTPIRNALVTLRDADSAKVRGSDTVPDHIVRVVKPAGDYIVEVEKPGYRRVQFQLRLRGDTTWKVELPRSKMPLNFQRLRAAEEVQLKRFRP